MKRKKVVNSRFAKTPEYKEVIGAIEREGKCPFCPQNFKYHKNPVLKKRGVWFLTKSSWAYRNSHLHFLIVGKKHKERVEELKDGDLKNIFFLVILSSYHFMENNTTGKPVMPVLTPTRKPCRNSLAIISTHSPGSAQNRLKLWLSPKPAGDFA